MAKRIIVKVGTNVISNAEGELDEGVMKHIVEHIVRLREGGKQVVLVTSGAVGAGKSIFSKRPTGSPVVQKQLYAAVGQVKLMARYAELFGRHGYSCAQVLATKEDFRDDAHYENMENCFNALLPDGVVPIVNENDVVATAELMFTDNDELAGLVATQLQADALIIFTGTNGVLDSTGKTVLEVSEENAGSVESFITNDTSGSGRGGMRTKFNVARRLAQQGTEVFIANGKQLSALDEILAGKTVATHFIARPRTP